MNAQRELAIATHDDPDSSARLTRVIRFAGLVAPYDRGADQSILCPTGDAEHWLTLPQPRRWMALAEGLADRLPQHLRRVLEASEGRVDIAVRQLPAEFPLLPEHTLVEAAAWAELAEHLGLSVGGALTAAAEHVLNDDPAAALLEVERSFPALAQGIYLQPDLSVIVPGPLAPADEWALLEIAETEQLGVASTMRLSAESLSRALQAGHGVAAIRELLERLSLTGIPQPLDFLLGDLERPRQPGSIERDRGAEWVERIGAPGDPSRRAVGDSDSAAWDAAAADTESTGADAAGAGTAGVGTASTDAASAGTASAGTVAPRPSDEIEAAVERIFAAARETPGAGELTHRLELAIRDRSAVRVTAVGPDERTFVLQPLALSGGRLRAADQAAGVERTLPISAITAVEAA